MIEKYFLDELEALKKENKELKEEIQKKDNRFLVLEERPQVKLELIKSDAIFKRLDEKGIDLQKIDDEFGTKEVQELIKDLVLYREVKNDSYVAIIRINGKCYGLEKYYDEYKVKPNVYVDFDDAIYNLTDIFYDIVSSEITRRNQEKED